MLPAYCKIGRYDIGWTRPAKKFRFWSMAGGGGMLTPTLPAGHDWSKFISKNSLQRLCSGRKQLLNT
jgi:hypothetical protein